MFQVGPGTTITKCTTVEGTKGGPIKEESTEEGIEGDMEEEEELDFLAELDALKRVNAMQLSTLAQLQSLMERIKDFLAFLESRGQPGV